MTLKRCMEDDIFHYLDKLQLPFQLNPIHIKNKLQKQARNHQGYDIKTSAFTNHRLFNILLSIPP